MSITTYAELQTAVANWLNRTDLTSRIPEFISLAEARINRELRVRRMLQRSYATATTEFLELPDDWAGMRGMNITVGGVRQALNYRSPEMMDIRHTAETGPPVMYTILGDEVQLAPGPDTSYRVDMAYFQSVPALSDSATTNWLLTTHPDLYLFGASAEGCRYLKDREGYVDDITRFSEALADIHRTDKRDKYGEGPLAIVAA